MAFRRKRKPKVVWLPPDAYIRLGGNPAVAGIAAGASQFAIDFPPGAVAIGDNVTACVGVVGDLPSPEFQASGLPLESLSDIYNSGYRLRRIVGKINVSCSQSVTAVGELPSVLVTAGFIVLRVLPDGTPVQDDDTYSPAIINNWADPWIWRRTWALSNFIEAIAIGNREAFPTNNSLYGSVMDGPHVDAKTARIVSLEERLFLVVSIVALDVASPAGASTSGIRVVTDLRVLASLRQMAGNRRNASR